MKLLALSPAVVTGMIRQICELEVRARKPGNVSFASPGHGMTAEMFVLSAEAASIPLCQKGMSIGERILAAVEATQAAVGCNTNLGIILLLAPLVDAALTANDRQDLHARVEASLAELTIADAQLVFDAIRIAAPGGLGDAPRHDVHQPASTSLIEAMREAANHDRIARQYATGFADIFSIGRPLAAAALGRFPKAEDAVVSVFLNLLARWPDSHIWRKFGPKLATEIVSEAVPLRNLWDSADDMSLTSGDLVEFDISLKARGINPGTSADLTVAAFIACQLQLALDRLFLDRPATSTGGLNHPRAFACEFHQPV